MANAHLPLGLALYCLGMAAALSGCLIGFLHHHPNLYVRCLRDDGRRGPPVHHLHHSHHHGRYEEDCTLDAEMVYTYLCFFSAIWMPLQSMSLVLSCLMPRSGASRWDLETRAAWAAREEAWDDGRNNKELAGRSRKWGVVVAQIATLALAVTGACYYHFFAACLQAGGGHNSSSRNASPVGEGLSALQGHGVTLLVLMAVALMAGALFFLLLLGPWLLLCGLLRSEIQEMGVVGGGKG